MEGALDAVKPGIMRVQIMGRKPGKGKGRIASLVCKEAGLTA